MDINGLMQQAQKMQKDLEATEKELKEKVYTETVGGGMVEVSLNGNFQLENISINEELLEKENKEIIQDLVQMAINDVLLQANEEKSERMASLTSGISMPNIF